MGKFNKKASVQKQASVVKNKGLKSIGPKKSQVVKTKKESEYGSMSIDDFMTTGYDANSGESSTEEMENVKTNGVKQARKKNELPQESDEDDVDDEPQDSDEDDIEPQDSDEDEKESLGGDEEDEQLESDDGQNADDVPLWDNDAKLDEEESSDEYENEIKGHKKSLQKLKESDPEFYKYLQENDKKLLEFNVSDSEDEDVEKVHVATDDLDVASDESDYEDEKTVDKKSSGQTLVTLKLLKKWQTDLHTDKTNKTIHCVIDAFHAALLRVSNSEDRDFHYKVDGSSIFNGIIQLCVLDLSPAIRKYLAIKSSKVKPHKCKRFPKLKSHLQGYFQDLLKLLGGVASTTIYTVLLKHMHHMSILLVSFPNISKVIVKKLIRIWGTGEEAVKVLAFFCIFRITNNQLVLLDTVLKSMYMTYVINSKFVSPHTLSSINFMRRSMVEMFYIDPALSYRHLFLYIRQLAIHLRKAIVAKEKKNTQAVYNWQFVNSLKLAGHLLSVGDEKSPLQPLIYPFVQVCLGTIKLHPTSEYFPLRFHIVQILIDFSKQTGIFIPILPFILEVLNDFDFNKKHKKVTMKPINFTFMLRLSASQKLENGFKDATIDAIYGLLIEYLASKSNSIAFPDLTLFCIYQIKQFNKTCTVANYTKKMKQILEKIYENNRFIEAERKNINFNLTQQDKIKIWETQVLNKGTPLNAFYASWNKLRTLKKKKQLTNNEELGDYNLPVLKKFKKTVDPESANQPANPFPDTDSEDELEFEKKGKVEVEEAPSRKRKRKNKINQEQELDREEKEISNGIAFDEPVDDDGQEDVVEDLDLSDF